MWNYNKKFKAFDETQLINFWWFKDSEQFNIITIWINPYSQLTVLIDVNMIITKSKTLLMSALL